MKNFNEKEMRAFASRQNNAVQLLRDHLDSKKVVDSSTLLQDLVSAGLLLPLADQLALLMESCNASIQLSDEQLASVAFLQENEFAFMQAVKEYNLQS